jgi:hypothetical protein
MFNVHPLSCLSVLLLLIGCQSIPEGHDPVFAKGETVVELLSGRQGIVEDGYYSSLQRSWRYRVRFVPSSSFTSYGYGYYSHPQAGDATNRGVVWLYGYELLPLKKTIDTPPPSSSKTSTQKEKGEIK